MDGGVWEWCEVLGEGRLVLSRVRGDYCVGVLSWNGPVPGWDDGFSQVVREVGLEGAVSTRPLTDGGYISPVPWPGDSRGFVPLGPE